MEKHAPLFNTAYLRSVWIRDYESFKTSAEAETLLARLQHWAEKEWQTESASESAFIDLFFKKTWGYLASGEKKKASGFTLQQKYPVKGAGQQGGVGQADIALGYFGREESTAIPQVLGEFKDDRSGLDKPQINRPNKRSPVDQCLDYLREARTGLIASILPCWGLVTDMNEFRLYHYGNKAQYQRFIITPPEGEFGPSLIDPGEEAAFQRFLFFRVFQPQWLLTHGGKSELEKLLNDQILHEQHLENEFYQEYHAFRETIYQSLRRCNPQYETQGRLRLLVKYTQRILDRCLFILYCEDMGRELNYPPNVLRDVLMDVSVNKYYSPDGEEAWTTVKRLFASMRDGAPFGAERINRFNGGLFDEDAAMDALKLPNRVFCERNQGQSSERLLRHPRTLLFFSAKYNFGADDESQGRTLTLTAMGRIFEQSITDLEVMEASAEGRLSLTELTKRKRDGVYYTPEWVTHYIVEETVGARLAEIRRELGFDKFVNITDEQIKAHIQDGRKAKIVGEYTAALNQYAERLNRFKVVDPACGSGAFLIQAFKYLYAQRQWVAQESERVTRAKGLFDTHAAMRAVLSQNLYGVDINAESVEITRLALWLYTALPDRPLTSLDQNIRCGNSLISPDFYSQIGVNRDLFDEDQRARINTFDWEAVFPEVFKNDDPGFDCVIGNPPYVKLQHFRKIQADVAEYLVKARHANGGPLYESTQTGNFDMYLPFIEKGVELLNRRGKMGYIAPNVWMVNQYGQGLRRKLKRTQKLDRWVDFKSFQVFDEAITYTALQFFSGSARDYIRCVFAPNGKQDIAGLDWSHVKDMVFFHELPEGDGWVLMPNAERALHTKLSKNCKRLDESCKGITVGIQTSADYIYHLKRIGPNRYVHKPKGKKKEPVEIELEDAIMHPLVSGPEAKRYQTPNTNNYLLHPYEIRNGKAVLFSREDFEKRFPNAWRYLRSYEKNLRGRERGKMDRDDSWWAYNYPKNLDKQEKAKLMVPRLVIHLFCTIDIHGAFYLDNVDVNGILVEDNADLFYLAGVLNSPVADFIWRRISKPFQNDYRSANKQFTAPLPIPNANKEEKAQVVQKAQTLQELHTRRRDLLLMIDKRLESSQCENDNRDATWLWADVKSIGDLKKEAPSGLKGREQTAWAKSKRDSLLASKLERIDPLLRPGVTFDAVHEYGELQVLAQGTPLIEGIYISEDTAGFIAAQWRQKLRQTNVTAKFNARKLVNLLLKLRKTDNPAIVEQVVKIDADVVELDKQIIRVEADMNRFIYQLYELNDDEIRLVEADKSAPL